MDAKKRAGAIMDMVRWISVVEVSSKISCCMYTAIGVLLARVYETGFSNSFSGLSCVELLKTFSLTQKVNHLKAILRCKIFFTGRLTNNFFSFFLSGSLPGSADGREGGEADPPS